MTAQRGDGADDLNDVARAIGEAWTSVAEQRAAREAREEAARDALLVSDAERDSATQVLAAAYAQAGSARRSSSSAPDGR